MLILILFFLLVGSFSGHIYFLILYITRKDNKYLRWFVNTAISNIVMAGLLTLVALFMPNQIRQLNLSRALWLGSGLVMLMMLFIKVSLITTIYRRCQDPKNFHYSFFGKKVLHPDVVKISEIFVFFLTLPFFLFAGAYFLARLFNLIILGQL